MCSESWNHGQGQINGECPNCETPTVDGEAAEGCCWSPVICQTCGDAPCTGSC